MESRRVLPIAAIVVSIAAVLVVGAGVGAGVLELPKPSTAVAEGDSVAVHIRVYDAAARLLFSTAKADKSALEDVAAAFDGPFVVPPLETDSPSRADALRHAEPIRLDNTSSYWLGDQLIGKKPGDRIGAPVVGGFQGYDQTVRLQRLRGPFPISITANASTIDALAQPGEDGRLRLDDLLPIVITARESGRATIALDVADGDRLAIRQADFVATVVREPGADVFSLVLDAEEGDTFTLLKPCKFARYVLPVGSYRVEAVTAEEIVLSQSPTRWPQVIGRPVIMVLEIDEILDKE